MSGVEKRYIFLIEILRALASPYEVQAKLFPERIPTAFELAMSFEDEHIYIPEYQRLGIWPLEDTKKFDDFLDLLFELVEDPMLDSLSALKFNTEWEKVRNIAKELLSDLGEVYKPPNPKYV